MKPPTELAEPPAVVTITSRAPAVPEGEVNWIEVALVLTIDVAAAPPIVTPVVPVRLVPVRVTTVPPVVEPEFGLRLVIVGLRTGTLTALTLITRRRPGLTVTF